MSWFSWFCMSRSTPTCSAWWQRRLQTLTIAFQPSISPSGWLPARNFTLPAPNSAARSRARRKNRSVSPLSTLVAKPPIFQGLRVLIARLRSAASRL